MQAVNHLSDEVERDVDMTAAFREHRTTVYGIACRIVGRDAAEDVTQKVFLRVFRRPEAFDPNRGSLRAYLSVLTRGMAIDHVRSQVSARNRDGRTSGPDEYTVDNTMTLTVDAQASDRVRRELTRLRAVDRDAIVLAFYKGFTYTEVATLLGIPEGTAKSRIRRGLTELRYALRDL